MDPGADRRGADVDQAGRFTDVDDSVVVLRPDVVDWAQLHAPANLTAGLTGRLVPGFDVVVDGENLAGIEEIGRTELPNGADVAARDPAAHRRLCHAEQMGNIAGRDLRQVAQVLDGVVVFISSGAPHCEGAGPRVALEPRPTSGTGYRGRNPRACVAGQPLDQWLWLGRHRALGKVAVDDGFRDRA